MYAPISTQEGEEGCYRRRRGLGRAVTGLHGIVSGTREGSVLDQGQGLGKTLRNNEGKMIWGLRAGFLREP